jgi:serine/threonine protein kinase
MYIHSCKITHRDLKPEVGHSSSTA